jgi:hypothetical protein
MKPKDKLLQRALYSQYYGGCVFKVLLGITPCGAISFVSDLFAGSVSDGTITEKSGVANLLEAGDTVLCDKGFTCWNLFHTKGVRLVMPPTKPAGRIFSFNQTQQTTRVASLRTFIEHAIRKLKQFKILCRPMQAWQAQSVGDIVYVCAMLCNLQPSPSAPLANSQEAMDDTH